MQPRRETSMRAAFSAWGDRIAPVFEVAQEILLVDAGTSRAPRETREELRAENPVQTALRLVDLAVATLVCGAVSRPTLTIIQAYGVEVRPFLAGDLHEVVDAWLAGNLDAEAFAMPGCGCERRRSPRRHRKR
jgi:predicted Fe-Mo cluster-binding NifX family protein